MEKALIKIKNSRRKLEPIIVLILSVISFIISKKWIQPQIFDMSLIDDVKHIYVECIFFIVLLIFYNYIIRFIKGIKSKKEYCYLLLKNFLIFAIINCVFLLLIWPGHWVWDEITVLNAATRTELNIWQSYITVIYYSLCMMVIPYACGITIIQSLFISFVMSYVTTNLYMIYKKKSVSIALYLVMLIPSVILNNLRPLRLQVYTYILVLLFGIIIFDKIRGRKLTVRRSLVLLVLSALLILWRSEGIIFCIFIPALMLVSYNKKGMNYIKAILMVVLNVIILLVYNHAIDSMDGWVKQAEQKYGLTMYINPLSQMIQEDLHGKDIEKDLENIDKVLNLEILKKYPSYIEIPAFWNEDNLVRENFAENLSEFKKSYVKILLNNPISFIKARIKTFLATCYYEYNIGTPSISLVKYYKDSNNRDSFTEDFLQKYKFTTAINENVKVNVETFLTGAKLNNQGYNKIILYLFWDVLPVMIICTANIVISFIKKKYEYLCMFLTLMCNGAIIFLTAPANYFMYYFPMYVTGIITSICFWLQINNKKENNEIKL